MHMHQETHGDVFHWSHSKTRSNGQRATSGIAQAVSRKTALQRARLAIITHLFAFLSLLCLDPANCVTSVILSAVKVATSVYERGVNADRAERRSHHD
jgi:hypothetical protein